MKICNLSERTLTTIFPLEKEEKVSKRALPYILSRYVGERPE
jgi:hypothetical protein